MSEPFTMDRRALLQRAFVLAGATLAPGASLPALAQEAAPQLLDPKQFALLSAIADTIVPTTETPGAVDVGVPRLVDGLLRNGASPASRVELIAAMDEIDALAVREGQQGFATLTPADRLTLLAPHDAAALKHAPPPTPPAIPVGAAPTTFDPKVGRARGEPVQARSIMAGPRFVNPGYGKLKELIVSLYYYSEPALTQELTYEHSPGEWQPSIPLTPETRATGGFGLF